MQGEDDNAGFDGYMPYGKPYGFVRSAGLSSEKLAWTIAHELGHGAFQLQHVWKEQGYSSDTRNLMSYSETGELFRWQWEHIHNPVSHSNLLADVKDLGYQTDAHYGTVYYVALQLGIDKSTAEKLAVAAEYPDGIIDLNNYYKERYTWLPGFGQKKYHALTGKDAATETNETLEKLRAVDVSNDKGLKDFGILLHRLGDTFGHRRLEADKDTTKMYPPIVGHIFSKEGISGADMVYKRPSLYLEYASTLCDILIERFPNANSDNKEVVINTLKEILSLLPETDASLIGIIDYHSAVVAGSKCFPIYKTGNYKYYIKTTEEYLLSKKVNYKTEKIKQLCGDDIYGGMEESGTMFILE